MGDVMKRTCRGCKAIIEVGVICYGCELGYKTDSFGKPLEECPKPKTYDEYAPLLKDKTFIKHFCNNPKLKEFTKKLIELNELLWNACCVAEEIFGTNNDFYDKYIKNTDENQRELFMKAIACNFNKLDKNDDKFVQDGSNNSYIDEFTELGYNLNNILDENK